VTDSRHVPAGAYDPVLALTMRERRRRPRLRAAWGSLERLEAGG
jgi:hypothetical protein